jgi:choline dehydrogenase-like flavoprotein
VLVLERGPNPYRALGRNLASELTSDELKAFQRRYGWADPLTEPRTFRPSASDGPRTHAGQVNDLPAVVGGGAGLATMLTPRMREVDFVPRTRFGDIPGSILTDWPLAYRDLAPHYDAVERLLGVQGRTDDPFASPRRAYPLPPGVPLYANDVIARGAERLGISAPTAPLAITSKRYRGRPGCNECGRCWYYGCPVGAHGGMAPSVLGRAVATGRCRLSSGRFVLGIEAKGRQVTGVRYLDAGGRERAVHARHVLLGAGPIEDVRLMLLSELAGRDRSGLLGRGLVFHFQTFAGGYFSRERLHTRRGRGLARMITEFCGPPTLEEARRWSGVAGGGVVEISGLGLFGPITEGQTYPRGGSHSGFMSANLFDDHIAGLLMQGEDLPQHETVVDLDPDVVDFRGLPVARLTYQPHPFEVVASSHYGPRLAEILLAAGADLAVFAPKNAPVGAAPAPLPLELPDEVESVLNGLPGPGGAAAGPFAPTSPVPNTQHILSGFRMGRDPDSSVCSPSGRLHGFDNLHCVDGGLFCSSTPVNPTLTIWALAHRVAKRLARRRRKRRRRRQVHSRPAAGDTRASRRGARE